MSVITPKATTKATSLPKRAGALSYAWRWDSTVKVRAMADHKFKIGQMVFYHPKFSVVAAPINRPYQIAARLPSPDDGEPLYRIRSAYEEHERSASESELRPVQAYSS